ncbi:MAG: type I restriction-modification system subunit M N-terminal domain-containing protein [Pirellulaceae bacterium]
MTGAQQRAALQRQIWQIANDVRGAVDGWDFKQYVLGALFYRFISENFGSIRVLRGFARILLQGEPSCKTKSFTNRSSASFRPGR